MDNTNATREILWNVNSTADVVFMYLAMTAGLIVAAIGIFRHIEFWNSGKEAPEHTGDFLNRFKSMFSNALMQKKVVRETLPAIAHTLIYLGFLALLFATSMVFIDHDLGIRIYKGEFYLGVTVLSDVLGLGVIIGCTLLAHRRYVNKADLVHSKFQDAFFLIALVILCLQGYILEGLRIHVTNDPWQEYSPIGMLFAKFFWFLTPEASKVIHYLTWWFHALSVFALFALLPYTKFFHIIGSSLNLYFKDSGRPKGALKYPGDIEELLENGEEFSIGIENIKDFSWKQLMDLDACTSCGRCQSVCPAYNSGKILSPKWLILDSRNHGLLLNSNNQLGDSLTPSGLNKIDSKLTTDFLLKGSGVTKKEAGKGYESKGAFRALNEKVQNASNILGESPEQRIAGDVMDKDVFWSCNTCMACVEACPVGINHVDLIVENRRNMVLMHGDVPEEAQATLRALETRGNPFGAAEDRIKWTEGLDVPLLKEGDEVDYLFWVGCVSSFDPRKQKIAKALVQIFNKLDISYGILGNIESCSGDPARRIGEENLFQMLAKQNIKSMKAINFKNIVTNCPHCFNTIKNEYPQIGEISTNKKKPIVFHHSQLLNKFLAEDKIELKESYENYTFHDPCYLGRYNDEYEAPRDTIKKVKGLNIIEMDQNKEKGMCCGAGGGHFWFDMKVGDRVNALRTDQAAATGASKIATACPFCMQMMEDGVKITNREEEMEVLDIAEVIAMHMV